jgi:hypothetical protein
VKSPPPTALVWFGVLGGALAWATQFVVNLAFTWAQCNQPGDRWRLPVHGWGIALSAVAIAIGLAAEAVCVWLFLQTWQHDHVAAAERSGEGTPAPTGRINFLAMVGLCVNFLSLAIVVMTAIGAPLLPVCQQS